MRGFFVANMYLQLMLYNIELFGPSPSLKLKFNISPEDMPFHKKMAFSRSNLVVSGRVIGGFVGLVWSIFLATSQEFSPQKVGEEERKFRYLREGRVGEI